MCACGSVANPQSLSKAAVPSWLRRCPNQMEVGVLYWITGMLVERKRVEGDQNLLTDAAWVFRCTRVRCLAA